MNPPKISEPHLENLHTISYREGKKFKTSKVQKGPKAMFPKSQK